MLISYDFLKFVNFKNLGFWDYKTYFADSLINFHYTSIKLSELITHRRGFINIKDDQVYKRCRVQINGAGIILRDELKGKEIKTKKQQVCKKGDVLVAEIDAKMGGFGIVPEELDGAIVSSHYFLYNINEERLLGEYLEIVFKSTHFQKQVQATGSTNYAAIRPYHFLEYEIPLPDINEQQVLVDNYKKTILEAKDAEERVSNIDLDCKAHLNKQLGLSFSKSVTLKGLQFLRFKDTIQRWDPQVAEAILTGKFPLIRVKDLLKSISTGTTPPTVNPEYFNGEINFYTPSELSDEMYLFSSERKVSELAIKHKKARVFHKNTLLFVGIGSTVGKVGLVGNEFATANQQITGLVFDEKKN